MAARKLSVSGGADIWTADATNELPEVGSATFNPGAYAYVAGVWYEAAGGGWQAATSLPDMALGARPAYTATAIFSVAGVLATGTGRTRWYNETGRTLTIAKIRIACDPAPTGQAILVDVNRSGTTIYTTQANRPQIAASAFTGTSTNPDVTTIADGAYFTIDIDQVGSSVAGSNLSCFIYLTG